MSTYLSICAKLSEIILSIEQQLITGDENNNHLTGTAKAVDAYFAYST